MSQIAPPPDPMQRPAIAGAPLSVVLPAHNAAAILAPLLEEWSKCLDGLGREYEILLVDDGSSDDTRAQAEALARLRPRLRILRHAQQRGFGAALRTGIDEARQPLLFYTTCDRQYRPEDLGRLLGTIDKVDLVSGLRLWRPLPGWLQVLHAVWRGVLRVLFGAAPPARSTWLGWDGFGRRLLARWIFGVRLQDPECSFRLFRRSLFARIPIQTDGPFAQVEILAKANFLGALMAEEPVSYLPPDRPTEAVDSPAREKVRAEAWRLFNDPDFGPPQLPPAPEAAPPAPAPPPPKEAAPPPPPVVAAPPSPPPSAAPAPAAKEQA
jgi:glycosyltransferase involved in cell wall biosynthesis